MTESRGDFSCVEKQATEIRLVSPAVPVPDRRVEQVRELAELGWPAEQIAEHLKVDLEVPELRDALEQGAAEHKAFNERRNAWRPTPADLWRVAELAKRGLTEIAVAAKMRVPREVFLKRLQDTPQLRDAYQQGNGEYHANRIDEFNSMVDMKDGALKYMTTPYIFIQKTGGLNDKPETLKLTQEVKVEGTVKHTHQLNAPPAVATNEIAEFAKSEMERARRINEEKLKAITVDAEITDLEDEPGAD